MVLTQKTFLLWRESKEVYISKPGYLLRIISIILWENGTPNLYWIGWKKSLWWYGGVLGEVSEEITLSLPGQVEESLIKNMEMEKEGRQTMDKNPRACGTLRKRHIALCYWNVRYLGWGVEESDSRE